MIHVCYALYDKTGKYSRLTGTSICSLFENTKAWVTIHLLHDNTLTEENREKFIQLARKYGNHIVFYSNFAHGKHPACLEKSACNG